jgi:lipid-binding SYLF domain-containing protein
MRISRFMLFLVMMTLVLGFKAVSYADEYSKTIGVFKGSPAVKPFFKNAYGYAVFPKIGKAGFIVGGAGGKGKVYANGKVTGTSKLMKGSIGLQAGVQVFSQIIFFENKKAYENFTNGNFEFDASASAVAITTGAQAKAGTEGATAGASSGRAPGAQAKAQYKNGMAVFVHTEGGFMLEASIGGQKFSFEPI